jgi:kinesin family protein 1
VQVKNFALGLEWIWTKEKFLNRKSDMTDFLLDFKEDGKIDKDKYAAYDPFYESPDTETQVGSAMLYPKSFVYMISFKGDFKILDFKSKEAGIINVEVLPCTADGKVIDPSKGGKIIKHPETDLLNKNISFIININIAYGLDEKFEVN